MKEYEYIQLNYNHLLDGQSERGSLSEGCYRVDECGESPSGCDLHVTRDGNKLLYNCFSSSCACAKANGARGCVTGDARSKAFTKDRDVRRPLKSSSGKEYVVPRSAISTFPRHCLKYLEDNNVTRGDAIRSGMLWDTESEKLIFPLNNTGKDGYVYRVLRERNDAEGKGTGDYIKATKWLRQFEKLSLPHFKGEGKTLYVVESLMSALAIKGKGFPATALLGINIDDVKLRELRRIYALGKYESIELLPDPDVARINCLRANRKLNQNVGKCNWRKLSDKARYVLEEI